jgi:hypothetical protein
MALAQSGIPADEEIDHPVLLPKAALQEGFTAAGRPLVNGATAASLPLGPTAANVGVNYLGVGVGFNGYSVPDAPTDVNLAVGDTQVVQWVNVSYAVFDKAGGGVFKIQTLGNALWSGFGAPCETHNSGDIIAQWDKVAHRWVVVPTSIYSAVRGLFCDLPDAGRIRPVLPLRLQHE